MATKESGKMSDPEATILSTRNAIVIGLIATAGPAIGVLVWAWLASSLPLAILIPWIVIVVIVMWAGAVFGWRRGRKASGADAKAAVTIKSLQRTRTIVRVWLLLLPLYLVGLFLIEAPVTLYIAVGVMFAAGLRGVMLLGKIARRMSADAGE